MISSVVLQDIAAEQSTMAYRAPELFDVKTGVTLDEKVDIWVRLFPSQILRCTHFTSHSVAHYLQWHTRILLLRTHRPRSRADLSPWLF